jgi:uncharacterized protein
MNLTRHTTLANNTEQAVTPLARRMGLLGRDGLDYGDALHITQAKSIHTVGMRFPIDVVLVDKKGNVVRTAANVGEGKQVSHPQADSVLELPVGIIQQSRTVAGDRLVMQ